MMTPFRRKDIFEPATFLEKLTSTPVKYFISLVYRISTNLRSVAKAPKSRVRVVCISDTHCHTTEIPDGDLLIHAGDLTNAGNIAELQAQIDWLDSLPHRYKIAIAGNHDTYLDPKSRRTLPEADSSSLLDWKDIRYLQHSSITLDFNPQIDRRLTVHGAPQIPQCGGSGFAFQYPRGQDAWSETLPRQVDILVTHTPPKFHRDSLVPWLGCEWLLKECWAVRPRLHVFGHVHVGAGREVVQWDEAQRVYERALARPTVGFFHEILNPWLWIDLVEVVVYGLSGVLWDRVWGGEQRTTTMVNAAVMYNNTGKLGRPVQIIDI